MGVTGLWRLLAIDEAPEATDDDDADAPGAQTAASAVHRYAGPGSYAALCQARKKTQMKKKSNP